MLEEMLCDRPQSQGSESAGRKDPEHDQIDAQIARLVEKQVSDADIVRGELLGSGMDPVALNLRVRGLCP